jgi:hypothetical protein
VFHALADAGYAQLDPRGLFKYTLTKKAEPFGFNMPYGGKLIARFYTGEFHQVEALFKRTYATPFPKKCWLFSKPVTKENYLD